MYKGLIINESKTKVMRTWKNGNLIEQKNETKNVRFGVFYKRKEYNYLGKKRIYKTIISVVTHGCEMWKLNKKYPRSF